MAENPVLAIREVRNWHRGKLTSLSLLMELAQIETDECINWPRFKDKDGYGRVQFQGRFRGAHQLVCWLHNGDPDGRMTLHNCDNPGCVNYRHLRFGTHLENVADCKAKGRQATGSSMPHTKLSEQLVREIRASPLSSKEWAERLGTTRAAIWAARVGKRWKHVA